MYFVSSTALPQLYFFFQAEDGIRDGHVTGVQTCALPILTVVQGLVILFLAAPVALSLARSTPSGSAGRSDRWWHLTEIGRASCRERVWIWVDEVCGRRRGEAIQ